MAVKFKVKTYYKENIKHRTQRDKINNVRSSNLKFANHTLSLLNKNSNNSLIYNLPKKLLNTIRKNQKSIRVVGSGNNLYSNSLIQTNSVFDKFKLKGIHSNLTFEPINQSNKASKNIEEMNNLFNYIHNVYSHDYYAYMMTLTVPNFSIFEYPSFMRGSRNNSESSHYSENFPDLVRSMMKYLNRHFSIFGGVKSFETTINKDKMISENPFGILHPHCHCLIISKNYWNVKKLEGVFFREWCKLCRIHNMDVSEQAFDLEQVYSKNSNDNSFSKAISEATKYVLKPDFYKNFPNKPTEFSSDLFASLMSGNYGFRSSVKFGKVAKLYSSLNNSNKLKNSITTSMNFSPDYNLSDESVFPSIISKNAQFTYAQGKKEQSHFKISKVNDMSLRDLIYFNSGLLKGSLLSSKHANWVRHFVDNISNDICNSSKSEDFNLVDNFIFNLSYINNVDDFLNVIDSISQRYLDKGKSVAFEDLHAFHVWKDRYKDLQRLIKAIQYYDDCYGNLKLGYHTNPNLRFKVFNWINAYKSSINLRKHDWKRSWRFFADFHNGENQVLNVMYSDDEYQDFMSAIQCADDYFGDFDSVRVNEKACPKRPYCFVKWSNGLKLKDFGMNTGEIIMPSTYDKLTAPIDDYVNYDQSGTRWNVNMFVDLSNPKQVKRTVFNILKPFIINRKK